MATRRAMDRASVESVFAQLSSSSRKRLVCRGSRRESFSQGRHPRKKERMSRP